MGRCRTFILRLFRPALRPLKLPSQIGVPGRGRTCGLSIISRTLYQLSYENIYVEADNRLLLSWRHGVFPRPGGFPPLYSVGLHGAAERTRTSKPKGLSGHPLSKRADCQLSHCCRLPGRTIFTLFHHCRPHREPGYPGARYGCSYGDRGGTRTHRPYFRPSVFGTEWLPLPHPAVWRRGRDLNPQAPFTGARRISNPLPYHWAHLSTFDYK